MKVSRQSVSEKKSFTGSYERLKDTWKNQPYKCEASNSGLNTLIQTNPALKVILEVAPCISWILNVQSGKYIFISSNVRRYLDYSHNEFLNGGLDFTMKLIHPDDSEVVFSLLGQVWHHLVKMPLEKRENYHFSCDYRLRKSNGSYLRVLEQNTVLQTDFGGNITHLLGMWTDISNVKRNDAISASLFSSLSGKNYTFTAAEENLQIPEILSKREKEILKLVSEGFSSKQIASELFISHHTVNRHRQNIMVKTNRKNTSDLVQFGINKGLI